MRTALFAVVVTAVELAACDGSTAPVADDYQSLPADQVTLDMNATITSSGVRRAHLEADTALVFDDSQMMDLRVVRLQTFDDAGQLRSTLTSESGEYNQATQTTVARGNVVLEIPGPDGGTIWTEELHYDPNTKRIWSDVPTRYLRADGVDFHGQGFTTDDQLRNIQIRGGAGTNIPLPVGPGR